MRNGIHEVELIEVSEREGYYGKNILVFLYEVVSPVEHAGAQLNSWINYSGHPKSKLSKAIHALTGKPYTGQMFDFRELVGSQCLVDVVSYKKSYKIERFIIREEQEQSLKSECVR